MTKQPEDKKATELKGPLRKKDFGFRSFFNLGGKSDTLVERLIKQAEAEGKFNNLSGHGQPLKIEEPNPYESDDMRLANKVLKNAGFSPPWIEMDKHLEEEIAKLRRARENHIRYLREKLDHISRGSPNTFFRDLQFLSDEHKRWLGLHVEKLAEVNDRIHSFNQICPVQAKYKVPIQIDRLMQEYEERCPAIPTL
jgi:hypothetical protein